MYSAETGGQNRLSRGVYQPLVTTMAVVLAVTNRRDGRGEEGMTELEARRRQVRDALLGWIPPGQDDPVTCGRGRLLALDEATLWWSDEFNTSGTLEAEQQ
jgi:hypothetical protein